VLLLESVVPRVARKQAEKKELENPGGRKSWKYDLEGIAEKSLYRFECRLGKDKEVISDWIQTIFKAFVFLFFFFAKSTVSRKNT